jgi:hypothetical protein
MAANMPQMAGNGHIMQQNGQRQLQAVVYNQLMSNPPPIQGWQSGINVADRFGKTMNLFVYILNPLVTSSIARVPPLLTASTESPISSSLCQVQSGRKLPHMASTLRRKP